MSRNTRVRPAAAAWAAFILTGSVAAVSGVPQSAADAEPPAARTSTGGSVDAGGRASEYVVRAKALLLGDLGAVGNAVFERRLETNGTETVKTVRLSGRSKPEMARKGRDIEGEFTAVTRSQPAADGSAGSCSWVLSNNGVAKRETIAFFSEHAVSTGDKGGERKVDGRHENLLSWLEFFLDNPVRPGDVRRSRFILDGHPYIFKCDVGAPEVLKPFGVEAYRIDLTMYDGLRRDGGGAPRVVRKKGSIRLWLCKEGKHRNEFLRLRVQYKWYLMLLFELASPAGREAPVPDNSP
jgi:hypothetical protein